MRATFIRTAVVVALAAAAAVMFAPSRAVAATDPVKGAVEPFLEAVERGDAETAFGFLAPGAEVHAMFNPNGDASDAGIRRFPARGYFGVVMRNYDVIRLTDRRFSVVDHGRSVWMEAEGDLRVAATGKPYRNRYVFRFDLDAAGRIGHVSEWVNTVTLAREGVPTLSTP